MISRRRFNRYLATGLLTGGFAGATATPGRSKLRVAAIQMAPSLANVSANLEQAERLILDAQKRGAEWIALPEMFTSAAAFHPDMLKAIRDLDGTPANLMRRLAHQGNCVIGGSFLARRNGRVHNSFLLAFPDGSTQRHDKDYPAYWENCICQMGKDDGVLDTPVGRVGAALCWELIRSNTATRMLGKVKLVIGGSCWWTLPEDADPNHPSRVTNLHMLQQAPARMARLLGVPVVHGSHTSPFKGFWSPDLPDVPYDSFYLGEAMVVDAAGRVLGRRSAQRGAGLVMAEIEIPAQPLPAEPVPQRFWLPDEMPKPWKDSWWRWLKSGSHYYRTVTEPYLRTGIVNEYEPEYMQ